MADDGRGMRSAAVVELIRLAVVVATTAAGFEMGSLFGGGDRAHSIGALLGALVGYLLGGIGGRRLLVSVDRTQERLRQVESATLVAGVAGGVAGAVVTTALVFPLAFLPGRAVTLPIGAGVVVGVTYLGVRVGASRGGDLGRYVGVRGRITVSSPARGGGAKVVDTSALIDGRLLDVARTGFLEGTLVVPQVVVTELRALADSGDRRRRTGGRRGLDVLTALQTEHVVVVELTDDDPAEVADVDGKLAAIARDRNAALITNDTGLARVAEISGVRVLEVNRLADAVRPPAVPGQRIELALLRAGNESGQAVGYLPDGTMVVVERAADRVGESVLVEVTSINQTQRGRMLFAVLGVERRVQAGDDRTEDGGREDDT